MDTHVPDNTLIPPVSTRRPSMALPGEEEGELPPASPAAASAPSAPPRKSRRGLLLGSVAVAVFVVGAGVFLVSPYNTILPLGAREIFIAELHSLYEAREKLRRPDYVSRLSSGLATDLDTAEAILEEIIDKAPGLLKFGTGSP